MFVDAFFGARHLVLALAFARLARVPPPSGWLPGGERKQFQDAAGTTRHPHSEPGFVRRVGTAFSFNGIATQVEWLTPHRSNPLRNHVEAWISPGDDYSSSFTNWAGRGVPAI